MLDPITSSPWISRDVFSYLNAKELAKCSLVSKQWKQYTELLWINAIFISETEKWRRYYFRKMGENLPPPSNIREILNGPCPIWPGKKIFQTHILGLVPKTVPFCLESFSFVHKESYWILMTRNVLPEGKSYGFVKKLSQKTKVEYQIPSPLEALACTSVGVDTYCRAIDGTNHMIAVKGWLVIVTYGVFSDPGVRVVRKLF